MPEPYKIKINGNIDQKDVDELIDLFNSCEENGDNILDTVSGQCFNHLEINIIPELNEGDYFAEVDPLFLGYLVLLLNKFKGLQAIIKLSENPFIEKLKRNFTEEDYKKSKKISNRAFSISDQIGFVKKDDNFKDRIRFIAYWYNKGENKVFRVPVKGTESKRFFPTILLSTKEDVERYFDTYSNWDKDDIPGNYYNKVKEIVGKESNLKNKEFSIVQIYILRLLLSEYNPKGEKPTKEVIDYCIAYSKQLAVGLKELALNIVEHSRETKGAKNGFGVITGRIFEKERLALLKGEKEQPYISGLENNSFNLDLNIIDLGYQPVREKYVENIEANKESDSGNQLKIAYDKDVKTINDTNNFQFEDFYIPNTKTEHQLNKLISRFGLQFFTHILTQRFDALVKAISHGESLIIEGNKKDVKPDVQNRYGTSYNCIIPLGSFNEFYEKTKETEPSGAQIGPEESTLSDLHRFVEKEVSKKPNGDEFEILYFKEYPANPNGDKYSYIRKIYLKFLETKTEHRKNIFLIDAEKTEMGDDPSDWTRLLSALSLEFKNIIVKNIKKETTKAIIELRRTRAGNPSPFKFWSKESNILFYSFQKNTSNSNGRYGATVLTGEEEAQFNYINLNVWKNHEVFYKGFIIDEKNTAKFEPPGPFYSNGHLKYFDLVLKNEADFGSPMSLFEISLQNALNKDLPKNLIEDTNNKGYKIGDTHFRLGSKIHISNFYYAKRLFQNSFFTTPLAYLLSEYLFKLIKEENEYEKEFTLIGYESYSEFLISTTRSLLSKRLAKEHITVTHSTINSKTSLSRPLGSIKKNIFIIVPIASSFSTSVKIKNDLIAIFKRNEETKDTQFEFLEPNINLIVVGDDGFENKIEENPSDGYYAFNNKLLEDYGWNGINRVDKKIKLKIFGEKEGFRIQKYFIPVYSEWQKSIDCDACFPKKITDEKCLIETGSASVTPSLIFGYPKTKPNKYPKNKNLDLLGSLYYGNLKKADNDYLYFIRVAEIINKKTSPGVKSNKEKIIDWLNGIKKEFSESKGFDNKKVVLVTPSTSTKSNFIDLVNKTVFGYTANCLSISIEEDYIENTEALYADGLYRADVVIYVDDVLSTVNSFLETNYIIKYIRRKLGRGKGIDYCLSLINRMSFDCEENLILKLASLKGDMAKNLAEAPNHLFYYTKINNPTIQDPNNKFPLHKEKKRYKSLSKTASLDSIRSLFYKKRKKLGQHDLAEKIDLETKRTIDDEIGYGHKKLFQLLVLNELYRIFEYELKNGAEQEDYERERQTKLEKYFGTPTDKPLGTFKALKDIISNEFYEGEKVKVSHKVHEEVLLDYRHNLNFVILKLLCSTPLVYYKEIRESAFSWIICLLERYRNGDDKHNTIGLDRLTKENLQDYFAVNSDNYYSEYQKLKFLLKRSVQLKCNYIIHKDFFESIKKLIALLLEYNEALYTAKKENEDKLKKNIGELFETSYLPGKTLLYDYVDALHKSGLVLEDLLEAYNREELLKAGKKYLQEPTNTEGEQSALQFDDKDEKKKDQEEKKFGNDFQNLKKKNKYRLTTSKKLIYELIALIQELIHGHETKAIKLDETIDLFERKPSNENGDFNHYLRLLKLENTAAIEGFWKYLCDKKKNASSGLVNLDGLDLPEFENDPKYESIKKWVEIDDDEQAFTGFLKLKAELHNWQHSQKKQGSGDETSVIEKNIHTILEHTSNILGGNVEECSLSINYKNEREPNPEDIFLFEYSPKNTDDTNIIITREITSNSLAYKMYKGIKGKGYDSCALSNFEVIKTDGKYEYREKTDLPEDELIETYKEFDGKDNFNILLIRISEFADDEENQDELMAQAVLTFRLSQITRIDEKRLRMVLLVREALNKYINSSLMQNGILEYINNKNNENYRSKLGHNVKGYLKMLCDAYLEDDLELVKIINDALEGQLYACDINKNNPYFLVKTNNLKKRIHKILTTELERGFEKNEFKIDFEKKPKKITTNSFIHDIVLTEVLINVQRHSPNTWGKVNVFFEENFLVVKNKQRDQTGKEFKKGKGTTMCSDICSELKKKISYKANIKESDELFFEVRIPFKNQQDENQQD